MGSWSRRLGLIAIGLAIAAGLYLATREDPVLVDVATVKSGPMTVTIDEEGETRVRDIYTVSAPIAGYLDRTTLEEGEAVVAHETVVASIHPLDPPFLDERTRTELVAAVEAAKSAVAVAEVEHTRTQMAYELAYSEYRRALELSTTNVISQSQLEKAQSSMSVLKAQVDAAVAVIELRQAELASAHARLQQPGRAGAASGAASADVDCCIKITSPESGVVLKVLARSEQAVSPGARIAEIGNPMNLEIVVDLLSSDAPKIKPGTKVVISQWGGGDELEAVVRRIDPAAFTKVSSLGIEEQRVNAVLDLNSVPERLGHGYRVLARLVVWSGEDIVQVPIGALFRSGGHWSAFTIEDGRAALRQIEIGQMNNQTAQILDGIEEGGQVILYPSDLLEDGSLIQQR